MGLPNAGKSTFLAAVSAAPPKIADYPFTTLNPNLGVVRSTGALRAGRHPRPDRGRARGPGLGDRFLGHVERTAALIHLVDATGEAGAAWRTIRGELAAYGAGLADKTEIVALSKFDAVDAAALKKQTERLVRVIREFGPPLAPDAKRAKPLMLSTATRAGVTEVLRATMTAIETRRVDEAATRAKPRPLGAVDVARLPSLPRSEASGVRAGGLSLIRRASPATFSRREKGRGAQSWSLRASSGSMIGTPSRIG